MISPERSGSGETQSGIGTRAISRSKLYRPAGECQGERAPKRSIAVNNYVRHPPSILPMIQRPLRRRPLPLIPSGVVARENAAEGGSAASAPLPARWLLLKILTASYGAGAFGMLGLSPLSPSLLDGFGLTRFQLAFIVPAIYVGGLFFSLPGGRLADRIGVRPSFSRRSSAVGPPGTRSTGRGDRACREHRDVVE